jgi:3-oxoadipate enol-lactonase
MPTFQRDHGEKLYYLDENPGSRETILLLHGLGVNSQSWVLQIPDFVKAGYRVIAPDLPGFGQSSDCAFKGFVHMAAGISNLVQYLEVQSVTTLGISMGGIVALQLALDYPSKVDRLVLVNTLAKLDLGNPLLWPYYLSRVVLIQTRGLEDQAKVVARHLFPRPEDELYRQATIESIKEADLDSYRRALRAIARFNVQPRLREIDCPTLVITGANDTTIPAKNQLGLAEGIPKADHVIIQNAGHAVCIDQSESFNRSVLEFLARHAIQYSLARQVTR